MRSLTKVVFACDESGAKGYSDQDEKYDGEIGVFAGILFDAAQLDQILPDFQAIYDHYVPDQGKFHIADLPADEQEELRKAVYAAVLKHQIPCFWYAVHAAGFYKFHAESKANLNETREQVREHRGPPRVKLGSPRDNSASLHATLFSGLYGNLIAFLEERDRKHVEIEIRSDQIDEPIIRQFETDMGKLHDDTPEVHRVTGYDTQAEKVVRGQITIETNMSPEMQIDLEVERVFVTTTNLGDPFVLAADVISNSLNYHFRNRDLSMKYGPLNTPSAVETHPLTKSLDVFWDWGHGDLIGDGIFRHPKARPKDETSPQ